MRSAETRRRFSGARLRLARHHRGLTQIELGGQVDASHTFIGYAEAGHKEPGDVLAPALADALGVEVGYFYLPPPQEFHDADCFFRRRQATAVSIRNQVLAHATYFGEVVSYLDAHLNMPRQDLASIRAKDPEDIEKAAERVRAAWGLGSDVPIKNVTRAVENAGVPVTRFEELSEKVDAFSHFGVRSVIVLNDRAPSRSRWDVAHECGHLVLHVGGDTSLVASQETEAHRFAGAFLMPRRGFVREFPSMVRWQWEPLFRLKARWRVSLAALIRRSFDLRLIDALRYRQAYKYMSMQGWLRHEPAEVEAEEPELINNAFTQLSQLGTSPSDVADQLQVTLATLREIVGAAIVPETPTPPRPRNVITLEGRRASRRRAGPR